MRISAGWRSQGSPGVFEAAVADHPFVLQGDNAKGLAGLHPFHPDVQGWIVVHVEQHVGVVSAGQRSDKVLEQCFIVCAHKPKDILDIVFMA
jgi:hypothetical protein